MHLAIISLEWTIWDEEIKQLTIDTHSGQITILPGHDTLLSVLKPWLVKIFPMQLHQERSFQFILDKECVVFGLIWGILKVENDYIQVLTNMVIRDNLNPVELLLSSKQQLLESVKKHTQSGDDESWVSLQDLESQIQRIDLEIKIAWYKDMISR